MKTYTYKDKTYNNLYDLSEAMGRDGTFIPRTISDTGLEQLGVNVAETEEPIENIRARKIFELKRQRDAAEVEPIAYNGHLYDYDSKARDRIAAAIIALELQGEGATIEWTTADNDDAVVTAQNLRMIIASVAARSNKLHTAYRAAKAQVEAASTAEEVEAVIMNN
ncbi:DUF4376 domain-containing protein [Phascolarctobacterium succinatutens]|uniref:DUF4376 domain-containing protein n=1 Tax=Phascolarctobacterium succinatutens TaxID=626940 RepID=UPI0026F369F5|nr:DUF4376 domain-containing protein [Phascolarctobacterium succinatutens]